MSKHPVPTHIGFILDGNRRWAKKHGLPPWEGHLAGYNALKDVIEAVSDAGVQYISFYSWSTENWSRAEDEIRAVFKLVRRLFTSDIKQLVEQGFKLVVLGTRERLPDDVCAMIDQAEAASAQGTRATLVMCFNYGGQDEIVRAVNRLLSSRLHKDVPDSKNSSGKSATRYVLEQKMVEVEEFEQYLDHPEIPPCDLIVRTSGEQRLSNFMLWRSAYAELLFLDKFWPEMKPEDVTAILEEYKRRNRRHGG